MKRIMTVLPMALFLAASSGVMTGAAAPEPTPPPPPALDPVGTYDCLLDVEGMQLSAVMTISGEPGAYSGTVNSEMGPAPVSDIAIDGNQMTFAVDTQDMAVFFVVTFDGNNFSGQFDAGGMGGYISGTKR